MRPNPANLASVAARQAGPVVRPLPFVGDDAALVRALAAGHPGAIAVFYQRHAAQVQSILLRILGFDQELFDLQHDVFVRALQSIRELRDPACLKSWLAGVAVNTARVCIQRRRRHRWLRFLPHERLPEREAPVASGEIQEAISATYAVLDQLAADERVAFSLRFIDGMVVADVAAACRVSLSTVKRRLVRAERQFRKAARQHPALVEWLEGGTRWNSPKSG